MPSNRPGGGGGKDLSNPGEFFNFFGSPVTAQGNIQQTLGTLSGFGDPRFRALLDSVQKQLASATAGQARVSALRGARLGQDISSAIGAIGGGSTGVGAVARSLASSAGSAASAETSAQGRMLGAQLTGDMGMNYLSSLMSGGLQGGLNIFATLMQGWNQQSGILNELKANREQMWNPANILGGIGAASTPFLQKKK